MIPVDSQLYHQRMRRLLAPLKDGFMAAGDDGQHRRCVRARMWPHLIHETSLQAQPVGPHRTAGWFEVDVRWGVFDLKGREVKASREPAKFKKRKP